MHTSTLCIVVALPSGAPKSWYLQAGTPAETRAWREVLSLASDPAPLQVLGQQ